MKKNFKLLAKILITVIFLQCFSSIIILGADDYTVIVDDLTKDESIGKVTMGEGVTNAGPKATAYNETSIHSNTGSASSSFTWTPNLQKSGIYKVYVWYDVSENRPKTISYEVNHIDGKDTKTINQKENGGQWVELGSYTFAAGMFGNVTAIAANKYACFDAVKFEFLEEADVEIPTIPDETDVKFSIIVDNLAVNNTDGSEAKHIGTAAYNELKGKTTAYKDAITANVEAGESSFIWTPNLTADGPYKVYVWYDTAPDSRPKAVEYSITHAQGTDKVTINQKENSSQWVLLGTYDFKAGMSGNVTATAPAKYTCYDAVKFDYIGTEQASQTEQSVEEFSNIEDKNDRMKITLLRDLGIITDDYANSFKPEATMTKSDFVKILEAFSYVGNNLTSEPEKPITFDKVIEAMIELLNYKPDITNNNDSMTLANNIKLLDSVAFTENNEATCMDIVRIIYNSLEIPKLKQLSYNPIVKFNTDKNRTLLTENLNVIKFDGRLTGFGANSTLSNKTILKDDEISIDGKKYKYENISDYRLINNFGENVTIYAKTDKNSNIDKILSIINHEKDENSVTLNADNIAVQSIGSVFNGYSYYEDGTSKLKKIMVSPNAQVVYNGRLVTINKNHLNANAINYLFPKSGNVKLIADKSSDDYTLIIVTSYETMFVKSVAQNGNEIILFDHNYNNKKLQIVAKSPNSKITLYNSKYQIVDPKTITDNTVISVAKSADGINTIGMISTKTVSGLIEGTEIHETHTTLNIGGTSYQTDKTYIADDYILGQKGKFFLNIFNEITAVIYEPSASEKSGFGYIISIAEENGVSDKVLVKMLNNEGNIDIYSLASRVKVDGFSCKTPLLAQERLLFNINYVNKSIPSLNATNKTRNLLQPIRYELNSDAEINFVDTPFFDEEAGENPNSLQFIELAKKLSAVNYVASQSIFFDGNGSGAFAVNKNTITIIVPIFDEEDDELYVMKSPEFLKNYTKLNNVSAYRVAKKGFEAEILLVYANDSSAYGTKIFSSDNVLAINEINSALNSDGDEILKVTGIKEGKEITLFTQKPSLITSTGAAVVPGDIIRYSLSDDGEILDAPVERIFDISASLAGNSVAAGLGATNPATFTGHHGSTPLKAYAGFIYDTDGNYLQLTKINPQSGFDISASEIINGTTPRIMIYDENPQTNKSNYQMGSIADIIDYKTDMENCSKILFISVDKVGKDLIVFKKH